MIEIVSKFSDIKVFTFILFFTLHLSVSSAQKSYSQKISGEVRFETDSTSWIATLIEKDTVNVLFKLVFETLPNNQSLPPNGLYKVIYDPDKVLFHNLKNSLSYAFTTNKVSMPGRKELRQWQVKRLTKINPTNYPWVELK